MSKVVDWKNVGIAALAAVTIGGAANSIARGNSPKVTELGITGAQALLDTALPKGVANKSLANEDLFTFKIPNDAKVTYSGPLVTKERWTTAEDVVTPDDNLSENFNPEEIIVTVPEGCSAGHLYTIMYNNNGNKQSMSLVIPQHIADKPVSISPGDKVIGTAQSYSDLHVSLSPPYRTAGQDTDNEPRGNIIEVSDLRRATKK